MYCKLYRGEEEGGLLSSAKNGACEGLQNLEVRCGDCEDDECKEKSLSKCKKEAEHAHAVKERRCKPIETAVVDKVKVF